MIQKCDGVKILDLEEKLEATGGEYIVTAEKDNNYKLPLESVADIVIGSSKFKAAIKDVYESSTPTASVSLDKDQFLFSFGIPAGRTGDAGKDGKDTIWIVPINKDGTLPEVFFKGSEHLAGTINYDIIVNAKDGENKPTPKEIKDNTVYIKEVADGVTIDPTKTGIDKNAFEWTSLNLNANMKDLDGSEKMHFTLEGLDSSAQFRIVDKDGNITDLSSQSKFENGKWTINGIEAKDINSIEISHDKSVSGVKVEASTVDGDNVSTSPSVSGTFDLSYKADAKFSNGSFTLAKDMDIDFKNIGKLGFTNVEKIDLGAGNGKNELLNLTLQDVLDMGKKDGGNINLTILGDSQDKVSFADKSQWQKSETTIIENGKTFTQWSNISDSTVTLKIEQPISDGITN